jgi:hypothetical protein
MKVAFAFMLVLVIWNVSTEASADDTVIRLVCRYSYTIDAKGVQSGTTGEDFITIKYPENGQATIKKQGLGAEFHGKVSDEQIVGETTYKIQELTFHQELRINRYTGAFEITFGVLGKGAGLIHYGKCSPATEKLF